MKKLLALPALTLAIVLLTTSVAYSYDLVSSGSSSSRLSLSGSSSSKLSSSGSSNSGCNADSPLKGEASWQTCADETLSALETLDNETGCCQSGLPSVLDYGTCVNGKTSYAITVTIIQSGVLPNGEILPDADQLLAAYNMLSSHNCSSNTSSSGSTGSTGTIGYIGSSGSTGAAGSTGSTGTTGSTGSTGMGSTSSGSTSTDTGGSTVSVGLGALGSLTGLNNMPVNPLVNPPLPVSPPPIATVTSSGNTYWHLPTITPPPPPPPPPPPGKIPYMDQPIQVLAPPTPAPIPPQYINIKSNMSGDSMPGSAN